MKPLKLIYVPTKRLKKKLTFYRAKAITCDANIFLFFSVFLLLGNTIFNSSVTMSALLSCRPTSDYPVSKFVSTVSLKIIQRG